MPPMKSLFRAAGGAADQLRPDAQRQSGLLRYAAAVREARRDREPGLPAAAHGLRGRGRGSCSRAPTRRCRRASRGRRRTCPDRPPATALRRPAARHRAEPPGGKQILPRAAASLPRARGDRQGAGGAFMSPRPRTSPPPTTPAAAATPAAGDFYYRSCAVAGREWRTSATGSRRRHLARRPVREDDPEPHAAEGVVPEPRDYIVWQPSTELLAWVAGARSSRTTRLRQEAGDRPYMQEAMRVFPGSRPATASSSTGRPRRSRWTPPRRHPARSTTTS